jgi:hypothetical protein
LGVPVGEFWVRSVEILSLLYLSLPIKIIGMPNVRAFRLNDANALKLLREIAGDSGRVVILQHAKARMRERGITLPQVLEVLRKGSLAEPASLDIHGNWKVTVRCKTCGEDVTVAGAIDMTKGPRQRVFVITVFGG